MREEGRGLGIGERGRGVLCSSFTSSSVDCPSFFPVDCFDVAIRLWPKIFPSKMMEKKRLDKAMQQDLRREIQERRYRILQYLSNEANF